VSLELLAVAIALAGLLVTLGLIVARASSRLAVVETRVGDLVDDVKELRDGVKELGGAIGFLSPARARVSRESEEIS